MALLWMESLCYDLRVIGCPQWSVDRGGEARLTDSEAGRQREKITQNENKQENNVMNRQDEGETEQWRGETDSAGNGCSFPEEWNLPKLQPSFITAHRHIGTLATEPNKPLGRISFLIIQTLSGSTAPRFHHTDTRVTPLAITETCYLADQG